MGLREGTDGSGCAEDLGGEAGRAGPLGNRLEFSVGEAGDVFFGGAAGDGVDLDEAELPPAARISSSRRIHSANSLSGGAAPATRMKSAWMTSGRTWAAAVMFSRICRNGMLVRSICS